MMRKLLAAMGATGVAALLSLALIAALTPTPSFRRPSRRHARLRVDAAVARR